MSTHLNIHNTCVFVANYVMFMVMTQETESALGRKTISLFPGHSNYNTTTVCRMKELESESYPAKEIGTI